MVPRFDPAAGPSAPVLRKWALKLPPGPPLHAAILARLEQRAVPPPSLIEGHGDSLLAQVQREIRRDLDQGRGCWDSPRHRDVLSLASAVVLAEQLTIDSPVLEAATLRGRDLVEALKVRWARRSGQTLDPGDQRCLARADVAEWAQQEFWPSWLRWCLGDPPWTRPTDPQLEAAYTLAYRMLDRLAAKGSLRQMLLRKFPPARGKALVLVETAEFRITFPPRWSERKKWKKLKTPHEFAEAALADWSGTNRGQIKQARARSQVEHRLAAVWTDYARWLLTQPEALGELRGRLGLPIAGALSPPRRRSNDG